MKFLTFVDVHENKSALQELVVRAKKPDIDFVICAGDFSTFGRGMKNVLKAFHEIGKTFYVIPGNHEEHQASLPELVREFPHCFLLHRNAVNIGAYWFLGYGSGGFAQEDAEFRKISREWYSKYQDKKTVLVTHGPPFATALDLLGERHVGNKDYRKFIERMRPVLVVSGHLHETAGATDSIGRTKLVNPGPEGSVIELK